MRSDFSAGPVLGVLCPLPPQSAPVPRSPADSFENNACVNNSLVLAFHHARNKHDGFNDWLLCLFRLRAETDCVVSSASFSPVVTNPTAGLFVHATAARYTVAGTCGASPRRALRLAKATMGRKRAPMSPMNEKENDCPLNAGPSEWRSGGSLPISYHKSLGLITPQTLQR